jgi:hypothetical protein
MQRDVVISKQDHVTREMGVPLPPYVAWSAVSPLIQEWVTCISELIVTLGFGNYGPFPRPSLFSLTS